jgi:hypothetical protein
VLILLWMRGKRLYHDAISRLKEQASPCIHLDNARIRPYSFADSTRTSVHRIMNENHDELRAAVEGKRYVRASDLAVSQGDPAEKIDTLRKEALWQLSAVFRNAAGSRILAEQYGMSKKEVEDFLRKRFDEEKGRGNTKSLEPTFDYQTSRYLTFEEWLDQLMKKWDKLADSP